QLPEPRLRGQEERLADPDQRGQRRVVGPGRRAGRRGDDRHVPELADQQRQRDRQHLMSFRPAALELTAQYTERVALAPVIGYLARHQLDLFPGDPQIRRGPSLIAEDVGTGAVHEVAATATQLANRDGSLRVEVRGPRLAVGWANAGAGASSSLEAARALLEALVAAHAEAAGAWPVAVRHRAHVYRAVADPVSVVTAQLQATPVPRGEIIGAEIGVRMARAFAGRRATIALRQQAATGLRAADGPVVIVEVDTFVAPASAPLDPSALAALL